MASRSVNRAPAIPKKNLKPAVASSSKRSNVTPAGKAKPKTVSRSNGSPSKPKAKSEKKPTAPIQGQHIINDGLPTEHMWESYSRIANSTRGANLNNLALAKVMGIVAHNKHHKNISALFKLFVQAQCFTVLRAKDALDEPVTVKKLIQPEPFILLKHEDENTHEYE